jgi:hypothetical protein
LYTAFLNSLFINGAKSKDFWPTIKPFITNKGSHFTKNIILCEKDEIINDQNMVAECFNDFFINDCSSCVVQQLVLVLVGLETQNLLLFYLSFLLLVLQLQV